ncbi:hypothetical protein G3I59_24665 [Amycolatopsis rubida]|uniref:Uncharacterized protein n=1 Tax=Amycolatopsis rubida TaxID=112413 RepID=A0ABX0BWX5_9PSEU|nr:MULTISPECIES: hypothetical protein [Amycolatopsis]MYW93720.1 hypothetical protein [Amycolatopsis rubida]NEC58707.1 hypothetical protein [Amycolatopsis rubida]OAP22900.1 hypothetical protein A4R44_06362 [Amycolatopsis sp. M39]
MAVVKYLTVTPADVVAERAADSEDADVLSRVLQGEVAGCVHEFQLSPRLVVVHRELEGKPEPDQYNAYATSAAGLARLRQALYVFAGTVLFIGRARAEWTSVADADASRVRELVAAVTLAAKERVFARARVNKLDVSGRE